MDNQEHKQEIIIIKRKRSGEESHHGGVWKIAYADFMTAMMAFFLVMWLINASNEETRAQVASYFNPVKLVDATAQPRGLNDKEGEDKTTDHAKEKASQSNPKKKDEAKKEEQQKKQDEEKRKGEAELFRAPMETLDKIAGGSTQDHKKESKGARGGTNLGERKVHKYRDPFAPKTWQVLKVESHAAIEKRKPVKKIKKQQKQSQEKPAKNQTKKSKNATRIKSVPPAKIIAATTKKSQGSKTEKKAVKKKSEKNKQDERKQKVKDQARFTKFKSEIRKANQGAGPQVHVTRNKKGILISLTDDAKFGMFKVASAQPAKKMVLFMEKIAKVLAARPGKIIVKGHTDGRPFHSKDYDNWRLSTARAQIARYMLIRGGIKDQRFVRVEGHADRKLKIASNSYDARNRRIEILILD